MVVRRSRNLLVARRLRPGATEPTPGAEPRASPPASTPAEPPAGGTGILRRTGTAAAEPTTPGRNARRTGGRAPADGRRDDAREPIERRSDERRAGGRGARTTGRDPPRDGPSSTAIRPRGRARGGGVAHRARGTERDHDHRTRTATTAPATGGPPDRPSSRGGHRSDPAADRPPAHRHRPGRTDWPAGPSRSDSATGRTATSSAGGRRAGRDGPARAERRVTARRSPSSAARCPASPGRTAGRTDRAAAPRHRRPGHRRRLEKLENSPFWSDRPGAGRRAAVRPERPAHTARPHAGPGAPSGGRPRPCSRCSRSPWWRRSSPGSARSRSGSRSGTATGGTRPRPPARAPASPSAARARFAAADGRFTIGPGDAARRGLRPAVGRARSRRPGWSAPDSRQAYLGDTGLLVQLRWILGFAAGADLRVRHRRR